MSFTIDQVYKESVARKQFFRSDENILESGSIAALTISPATNPPIAYLIDELKILNSSLSTSGTEGTGFLQVQFPNYEGTSTGTYVFGNSGTGSVADWLLFHSDKVIEANSETAYSVKFSPPILIKGSNAVNSMTIGLPTDVDISSGSVSYIASGWQLKESDFD